LHKKFPALFGIQRFIILFTSPPLGPILSQKNLLLVFFSYLLKIHFISFIYA